MITITTEGRRALLLMLEHGVLTSGNKGFYPGFSTASLHRPVRRPTLLPLIREGWVERDELSGRMRLTDLGRIAAERCRGELAAEIKRKYPPRFASTQALPPRKAPAEPAQPRVRLPYADD
jgi:hypothetical protein